MLALGLPVDVRPGPLIRVLIHVVDGEVCAEVTSLRCSEVGLHPPPVSRPQLRVRIADLVEEK